MCTFCETIFGSFGDNFLETPFRTIISYFQLTFIVISYYSVTRIAESKRKCCIVLCSWSPTAIWSWPEPGRGRQPIGSPSGWSVGRCDYGIPWLQEPLNANSFIADFISLARCLIFDVGLYQLAYINWLISIGRWHQSALHVILFISPSILYLLVCLPIHPNFSSLFLKTCFNLASLYSPIIIIIIIHDIFTEGLQTFFLHKLSRKRYPFKMSHPNAHPFITALIYLMLKHGWLEDGWVQVH